MQNSPSNLKYLFIIHENKVKRATALLSMIDQLPKIQFIQGEKTLRKGPPTLSTTPNNILHDISTGMRLNCLHSVFKYFNRHNEIVKIMRISPLPTQIKGGL